MISVTRIRLLQSTLICIGCIAASAFDGDAAAQEAIPATENAARLKITVGRDTTRVDGPVLADGTVDYFAAIHEAYSAGVTPESNAVVALWKIVGPSTIPAALRPRYQEALGASLPPDEGDYLKPFDVPPPIVIVAPGNAPLSPETEAKLDRAEQFEIASSQTWTREECPDLFAWVQANRPRIPAILAAGSRPRWYSPILQRGEDSGDAVESLVFQSPRLPFLEIGRLLAAHATLAAGEGRTQDATDAIVALRRLDAFIRTSPGSLTATLGMRLGLWAHNAEKALFNSSEFDATAARKHLARLLELAPPPPSRDIDVWDRFCCLDIVMRLARTRKHPEAARQIRWDGALRVCNELFDRLAAAKSADQIAAIWDEHNALIRELQEPFRNLPEAANAATPEDTLPFIVSVRDGEKLLGAIIARLTGTGVRRHIARGRAQDRLGIIAAALVVYQREKGSYPDSLDGVQRLVPAETLLDPHSGRRFSYRRTEEGCLVYGVGSDGIDQQGVPSNAGTGADDIPVTLVAIEVPAPPSTASTPENIPSDRAPPHQAQVPTTERDPSPQSERQATDSQLPSTARRMPSWAMIAIGLIVICGLIAGILMFRR